MQEAIKSRFDAAENFHFCKKNFENFKKVSDICPLEDQCDQQESTNLQASSENVIFYLDKKIKPFIFIKTVMSGFETKLTVLESPTLPESLAGDCL